MIFNVPPEATDNYTLFLRPFGSPLVRKPPKTDRYAQNRCAAAGMSCSAQENSLKGCRLAAEA
jgi:hypothetical protein